MCWWDFVFVLICLDYWWCGVFCWCFVLVFYVCSLVLLVFKRLLGVVCFGFRVCWFGFGGCFYLRLHGLSLLLVVLFWWFGVLVGFV